MEHGLAPIWKIPAHGSRISNSSLFLRTATPMSTPSSPKSRCSMTSQARTRLLGPPDEMVTLSTVHQAKGIEWRAVFVIWLAEGRFPSFRMDDEEEERRLFYVAVTRARDRLSLVRPQIARDRYRVDTILDPSRFLSELPSEVRELVAVTEDQPPDGIDTLPAGGRYYLAIISRRSIRRRRQLNRPQFPGPSLTKASSDIRICLNGY